MTFLREHVYQLPLALHFDVSSGVRLVAFLGALRGFIEQTAPGMTQWESRTHNGIDYVRVTPSELAANDAEASVYYAASGRALIVSFDEAVLQRALDRGTEDAQDGGRQLGNQLTVQLDRTFLDAVEPVLSVENQRSQMILTTTQRCFSAFLLGSPPETIGACRAAYMTR